MATTICAGGGPNLVKVAFSPDNIHVAGSSNNGSIMVWNTKASMDTEFVSFPGPVHTAPSIVFSANGRWLAATWEGNKSLHIFDIYAMSTLRVLGHEGDVISAKWSPTDPTLLATCVASSEAVVLWDVSTGRAVRELWHDYPYSVHNCAFSSNGDFLIGIAQHLVVVWEVESGFSIGQVAFFDSDSVGYDSALCTAHYAAIMVGRRYLANVHLIRVDPFGPPLHDEIVELDLARTLPTGFLFPERASAVCVIPRSRVPMVRAIAFSPGGRLVATGETGGKVNLMTAENLKTIATLQVSSRCIEAVEFSSDGRMLMCLSYEATAYIWNLEDIARIPGFRGL